jgi:hypothetical protein
MPQHSDLTPDRILEIEERSFQAALIAQHLINALAPLEPLTAEVVVAACATVARYKLELEAEPSALARHMLKRLERSEGAS